MGLYGGTIRRPNRWKMWSGLSRRPSALPMFQDIYTGYKFLVRHYHSPQWICAKARMESLPSTCPPRSRVTVCFTQYPSILMPFLSSPSTCANLQLHLAGGDTFWHRATCYMQTSGEPTPVGQTPIQDLRWTGRRRRIPLQPFWMAGCRVRVPRRIFGFLYRGVTYYISGSRAVGFRCVQPSIEKHP